MVGLYVISPIVDSRRPIRNTATSSFQPTNRAFSASKAKQSEQIAVLSNNSESAITFLFGMNFEYFGDNVA